MEADDLSKTLSELMEPGSTLMIGIGSDGRMEFRPLTVSRVSEERIEILLDTREEWIAELQDGDSAYATLSDTRANTWVSLRGVVSTSHDPQRIDDLWNAFASAYFDEGRETPGIAVLAFDAEVGRYWSSPSGRIGSLISLIKARFGDAEESGEHGDVRLRGIRDSNSRA
jgi:general stress protein 26